MNPYFAVTAAAIPAVIFYAQGRYGLLAKAISPFETFYHELGHALTAMLMLCRVDGIEIRHEGRALFRRDQQDYNGLTNWSMPATRNPRGFTRFIVALSGYIGSANIANIMAIVLILAGPTVFGVVFGLFTVLMLRVARGTYAWIVTLCSIAMVASPLILRYLAPDLPDLQYMLPIAFISSLLFTGLFSSLEYHRSLRIGSHGGDAETLSELTGGSPFAFARFFVLYNLLSLLVIPIFVVWQNFV